MNKITNKKQMYELYEQGKFGNKTKSWLNYNDYLSDNFEKLVALRSVNIPGGPCIYNLSKAEAKKEYKNWLKKGIKHHQIHVSEMLPDKLIQLGGEICQSENYYDLYYYQKPGLHMRQGLKEYGEHCQGLKALYMIKETMDEPSYFNLMCLFQEWPEHTIEFTVCSSSVGELKWNTVFWECRYY